MGNVKCRILYIGITLLAVGRNTSYTDIFPVLLITSKITLG
jgi:hypothetical protein